MTTGAVTAPPPRVLGFWAAVSIVMGNMIGSGVFLLPASLAAYRGLSLAGWLLSAAGAMMLALVFARLSGQFPAAGGLYAYTRAAFGDTAGFLVAWGYWLSTVGTLAALAVALVGVEQRTRVGGHHRVQLIAVSGDAGEILFGHGARGRRSLLHRTTQLADAGLDNRERCGLTMLA